MNDVGSSRIGDLRWFSSEIHQVWRSSQSPAKIDELLQCAMDFDRTVVLQLLFWTGLKEGDWRLADACSIFGYSVVTIDSQYWGLIHTLISTIGDRRDIAEWLISNGANIERRGSGNRTPLHSASASGCSGIALALISSGADVNARTVIDDNETPLMLAVSGGDANLVKILIEHGADVSISNVFGRSSKDIAIESRDFEIIRILEASEDS
jgi:Ankyrin repeats (many copies)